MSKSKNKYWDNFYKSFEKSDKKDIPPSQFAAFCSLELMHSNIDQIVEIAAGEGRDSIFFAKQGFHTIALDKSINALNLLQKKESLVKTLKTIKIDAVNEDLPLPIFSEKLCAYYARFFLHTLEENDLKNFFLNLSSSMNNKDVLFVEYRNDNDETLDKAMPDHFRKFYKANFIKELAEKNGLVCSYEVSGKGYAKWNIDDAHVTRQIFIKEID
ncbi:MAG: hypothetical protein CMC52_04335 [Flavobacteriaceae bacterium]|nr:hypothetical protein [Flavobacteriaceae bacterium]|tara:strand:- start:352 stop:993 length:642 start_codon:yes stop_codon:yes gene_type:complete